MKPRGHVSIDSPSNRRIVAVLKQHGPMTKRQLAEAACIALRTLYSAREYVPALIAAERIHILRWVRIDEENNGAPQPIFAAGPGTNAPKPQPLTGKQRSRRYQKTARYEAYRTRRKLLQLGVGAIDPTLAALLTRATKESFMGGKS